MFLLLFCDVKLKIRDLKLSCKQKKFKHALKKTATVFCGCPSLLKN